MNIKLYNAAITQLRGRAMEALALIDMLLTDPTMVPDHSSLVEEIMKHSKALATHEAAMITLQQYFNPKQASPAQTLRQPQPPLTPENINLSSPKEATKSDETPEEKATVGTRDISPPRRPATLSEEELLKRSSTLRKSVARQKRIAEKKKDCKGCKKKVKVPPDDPPTIVDAVEVEEEEKKDV